MDPKKQEPQAAKKAAAKATAKDAGEAAELQAAAEKSAELEVAPAPPTQEQEAEEEVQQEAEQKAEPEVKEAAKAFKHNLLVSAEDDLVLDDLVEIWRPVIKQELEARHAMGMRIKVAYYSGTKRRAEYGDKIMLIAALRLDIDSSTLHKMVRFVEKFPDFAAFRKEHPEANWTEVRDLVTDKPKAAKKRDIWLARVDQFSELLDLMLKHKDELKKHVPPAAVEAMEEKMDKVKEVFRLTILVGQPFVSVTEGAAKKE